jgi:hypothetical protein
MGIEEHGYGPTAYCLINMTLALHVVWCAGYKHIARCDLIGGLTQTHHTRYGLELSQNCWINFYCCHA